jgi:hypothetical protein
LEKMMNSDKLSKVTTSLQNMVGDSRIPPDVTEKLCEAIDQLECLAVPMFSVELGEITKDFRTWADRVTQKCQTGCADTEDCDNCDLWSGLEPLLTRVDSLAAPKTQPPHYPELLREICACLSAQGRPPGREQLERWRDMLGGETVQPGELKEVLEANEFLRAENKRRAQVAVRLETRIAELESQSPESVAEVVREMDEVMACNPPDGAAGWKTIRIKDWRDRLSGASVGPVEVWGECNNCGPRPFQWGLIRPDHKPGDQCPCCYLDDYDCDGVLVSLPVHGAQPKSAVPADVYVQCFISHGPGDVPGATMFELQHGSESIPVAVCVHANSNGMAIPEKFKRKRAAVHGVEDIQDDEEPTKEALEAYLMEVTVRAEELQAQLAETEEINAEYRTTIAQQQVDVAKAEARLRQSADDCDECEHVMTVAELERRLKDKTLKHIVGLKINECLHAWLKAQTAERDELRRKLAIEEEQKHEAMKQAYEFTREIDGLEARLKDVNHHAVLVSGTVPNTCPDRLQLVERIQAIGAAEPQPESTEQDEPDDPCESCAVKCEPDNCPEYNFDAPDEPPEKAEQLPVCPDCGREHDVFPSDLEQSFCECTGYKTPEQWLRHVELRKALQTPCRKCCPIGVGTMYMPVVTVDGGLRCPECKASGTPAEWLKRNEAKDDDHTTAPTPPRPPGTMGKTRDANTQSAGIPDTRDRDDDNAVHAALAQDMAAVPEMQGGGDGVALERARARHEEASKAGAAGYLDEAMAEMDAALEAVLEHLEGEQKRISRVYVGLDEIEATVRDEQNWARDYQSKGATAIQQLGGRLDALEAAPKQHQEEKGK